MPPPTIPSWSSRRRTAQPRSRTRISRRSGREPSLPGLTRQSIFFAKSLLAKEMDPRVKPAGDVSLREAPRSNLVAALAQLLDDAALHLGGDRLAEFLSDHHALLHDRRLLLQELLTGRPAIERSDLAQLLGREGAGVERGDLVD